MKSIISPILTSFTWLLYLLISSVFSSLFRLLSTNKSVTLVFLTIGGGDGILNNGKSSFGKGVSSSISSPSVSICSWFVLIVSSSISVIVKLSSQLKSDRV